MKYAIVIMDGAADEPRDELGGKTVLEKARLPNVDRLSQEGRQGLVLNIPKGYAPGSDVAIMSLLGYDPETYYSGRAPLEAVAQEVRTEPTDWIFRCNLVTIADGVMIDHSAGHIDSVQGGQLIRDIQRELGNEVMSFYPGVSYRHLMVHKGGPFPQELTPPHDILEQPVAKYLPKGKNAEVLREAMERARELLGGHEINTVRGDLGENKATDIWLWGQGHRPQLESFKKRFGVSAAAITAVDLVRGLAKLLGMAIVEVPGATGYLDTNYAGKGQAAIETLAGHELVVVHVEAPDEAAHAGLTEAKVEACERIDEHVVGPLLDYLEGQEAWRMLVLPDHPTPIRLRTHTGEPVPFALAGTGITSIINKRFSEAHAQESGLRIERGHELMEYFLHGG